MKGNLINRILHIDENKYRQNFQFCKFIEKFIAFRQINFSDRQDVINYNSMIIMSNVSMQKM